MDTKFKLYVMVLDFVSNEGNDVPPYFLLQNLRINAKQRLDSGLNGQAQNGVDVRTKAKLCYFLYGSLVPEVI